MEWNFRDLTFTEQFEVLTWETQSAYFVLTLTSPMTGCTVAAPGLPVWTSLPARPATARVVPRPLGRLPLLVLCGPHRARSQVGTGHCGSAAAPRGLCGEAGGDACFVWLAS